jgi:hypothetical protein
MITMADTDTDKLQALIRDEIHSETSKIAWSELQRFFAAGKAVYVSPDLDLVEAALQISRDNSGLIRQWMDKGKLAPVSDDQARYWIGTDAIVWAVVVKPWVLVQNTKENQNEH